MGMAVVVIVLAFALQVLPNEEQVAFVGLPEHPLPGSCFARERLGVDCPGCGLTRSFVHLTTGDLSRSFARNRVGWLLALFTVAQIPYRLWMIRWPGSNWLGRIPDRIGYAVLALLLVNWVWKVITDLTG